MDGLNKHWAKLHMPAFASAVAANKMMRKMDNNSDVAMESEHEADGTGDDEEVKDGDAMEESYEGDENDGDDSDVEQDEDVVAKPVIRRFSNGVRGVANTVCVVHAANQNKGLSEYTQEEDILFPVGTILIKGIAKTYDGRRRAQPIAWIDGPDKLTPFTATQLRHYKLIVDHRFRLNSSFSNKVCATRECKERITWRAAGVIRRKINRTKSTVTMAYLKSATKCFQCRG
ncbi:hypothetical protein BGZ96_010424 [Linnemannia gamsii]|uniref:PiggyBac transposable element-derived protein domain-containing protein n=1 Tax=Linnemannia gamsii TaxID=64522 RepID=A0ABQ7JV69_9FUNG|nr:hypothetical protein BGZ96_010424 [Linnemannia gamsii]